MKRSIRRITLCSAIILLLSLMCSCKWEYISYYSKKENYVNAAGTLIYLKDSEETGRLNLAFDDLFPHFDGRNFNFDGENYRIVKENGILEKLKLGDRVEFISAQKYFGDGYSMPIVGITVNSDCLLEFEEGWQNLPDWLK